MDSRSRSGPTAYNTITRSLGRRALLFTAIVVFLGIWVYWTPNSVFNPTPPHPSAPPILESEQAPAPEADEHSPPEPEPEPVQSSSRPKRHWPGWEGISHIVAFGDSYSATSFDWEGAQPSLDNPLGNPDDPSDVSMNRPNWIYYITTQVNGTFIKTVNLASGGASLDVDYVGQMSNVVCVRDQVRELYLPLYASHPSHFDWDADDTLFAWWIGINDVGNTFRKDNASEILRLEMLQYARLVDEVYASGGRNFLFLTVPPIGKAPLYEFENPVSSAKQAECIADWNLGVEELALNLSTIYDDVTASVYNTHALFDEVIENPCAYEMTCGYKNTTTYCSSYVSNPPRNWDAWDRENCPYPVEDYFWRDILHPTYRVQNLVAKEVVAHLGRIASNNYD